MAPTREKILILARIIIPHPLIAWACAEVLGPGLGKIKRFAYPP
jgi:hypothetical protein